MSDFENYICDAIEIIVDKKVEEAGYDRTIQANIHNCEDLNTGKYSVKYQDNIFYAYAEDVSVEYRKNALVYVLIPQNDMTKVKKITGVVNSSDKKKVNVIIPEDRRYELIGSNVISYEPEDKEFQISSQTQYNTENGYYKVLYRNGATLNDIALDNITLLENLQQGSKIRIGASFRTNLSDERKISGGNYGIVFTCRYYKNDTNEKSINNTVERQFVLDVPRMEGTPFSFNKAQYQKIFFDIDTENFIDIIQIALFTQDFVTHDKSEIEVMEQNLYDIFVSNIDLYAASPIAEEELNGVYMIIDTPNNNTFKDSDKSTTEKSLIARLKTRGEEIEGNISYYWFIEDISIMSADDPFYCSHGGRGWKCLNEKIDIGWVPFKDKEFKIKKNQVPSRRNKIKCIAIYEESSYEKIITMINQSSDCAELEIISDSGVDFQYDQGAPTLTCRFAENGAPSWMPTEPDETKFYAYWAVEDLNGALTPLPVAPTLNADIVKALIDNPEDPDYVNRQRVGLFRVDTPTHYKPILYKVDISAITERSNYKCTLYYDRGGDEGKVVLGTASITLTNQMVTIPGYSLVLKNGSQSFVYDEAGVSPAAPTRDNPQVINSLSFEVYTPEGEKLNDNLLQGCKIKWRVPTENTLLVCETEGTIVDGYKEINNALTLPFSIANSYNPSYKNNIIELSVKYKDFQGIVTSSLFFSKQGEDGTNGTIYSCKIVPNSTQAILPQYISFTTKNSARIGYFNFKHYDTDENNLALSTEVSENNIFPFKAVLYKNGIEQSLQGYTVTWNMLNEGIKNENLKDSNNFLLSNEKMYLNKVNQKEQFIENPCNILKVTISKENEGTYYATLPIIFSIVSDDFQGKTYSLDLVEKTGFLRVNYSTSYVNPTYTQEAPFKIKGCINGEEIEDYSSSEGHIYSGKVSYLTKRNTKIEDKSIVDVIPIPTCDCQYVRNGIRYECKNAEDGSIGTIWIPIHFCLNRFGFEGLNGWDGNSLQIDKEGNRIYGAQLGAGVKDSNNAFTGIVMGKAPLGDQDQNIVGLAAYGHGTNTFFLDAENGSLRIGPPNTGILINTKLGGSSSTEIKSGNYKVPVEGKESVYQGMSINLNEGKLDTYGFQIDDYGTIFKAIDGHIGSWRLNKFLYSDDKKTGLNGNVIGYSALKTDYAATKNLIRMELAKQSFGRISAQGDSEGFKYVKTTDIKISDDAESTEDFSDDQVRTVAFWAGDISNQKSKFFVTHDGLFHSSEGIIGSGSNKIYIGGEGNNSSIYSGSKTSFDDKSSGFYIGNDGISLGSTFSVNSSGSLTANDGLIGGITLTDGGLSAGGETSYWEIDNNGTVSFNSGTIGGITIEEGSLQANFKIVEEEGKIIGGSGWKIDSDGNAYFNNVETFVTKDEVVGKIAGCILDGKGGIRSGTYGADEKGNVTQGWKLTSTGAFYSTEGVIGGITIGKEEGGGYLAAPGGQWKIGSDGTFYAKEIRGSGDAAEVQGSLEMNTVTAAQYLIYKGKGETQLLSEYIESIILLTVTGEYIAKRITLNGGGIAETETPEAGTNHTHTHTNPTIVSITNTSKETQGE